MYMLLHNLEEIKSNQTKDDIFPRSCIDAHWCVNMQAVVCYFRCIFYLLNTFLYTRHHQLHSGLVNLKGYIFPVTDSVAWGVLKSGNL